MLGAPKDSGLRCASFDGDGDRLVYFFSDHSKSIRLIFKSIEIGLGNISNISILHTLHSPPKRTELHLKAASSEVIISIRTSEISV